MSLTANVNEKANLIWAIADKLTGVYKPHEYGEVILPMTVIRRFDCILSGTRQAVWDRYESIKTLPMKDVLLTRASGHSFYNTSLYTFEKLLIGKGMSKKTMCSLSAISPTSLAQLGKGANGRQTFSCVFASP